MNGIQQAPVIKNYSGVLNANSRIPTFHDTQDFSSDNATNGVIELFPPNPSSDIVARNYDDNPLPGNYAKRIVGMGFAFSTPILKPATNIDPVQIVNALKHTAVILSRGDRRQQIIRGHMTDFVDFTRFSSWRASYDDGTNDGATQGHFLKSPPIVRLAESKSDSVVLEPDERFTLELEPNDSSLLPSDSDWGNATSGALGVIAFLQVIHRHNR